MQSTFSENTPFWCLYNEPVDWLICDKLPQQQHVLQSKRRVCISNDRSLKGTRCYSIMCMSDTIFKSVMIILLRIIICVLCACSVYCENQNKFNFDWNSNCSSHNWLWNFEIVVTDDVVEEMLAFWLNIMLLKDIS